PGRARAFRRRRKGPDGGRNPPGRAGARQPGALNMRQGAFLPPALRSAVWALLLVLSLSFAVGAAETFEREPLTIVTAGGKVHAFTVDLAVTPNQRAQGLMNRREMAEDHGMLFVFGETRHVLMWM